MSTAAKVQQGRGVLVRALALSLGPAVALGLARFGYALLLPAMRTDLNWSYAAAGGMNTANALGYLAGALVAAPLGGRLGVRHSFWGSLLMTGLVLFASGLTDDFTLLLLLRLFAGFGGAVTFIGGATLAAHAASSEEGRSGLVLGLYFGGVGLGILATGLSLPVLLAYSAGAWRLAWMAMGAASLLALLVSGRVALSLPELPGRAPGVKGKLFRAVLVPSLAAYFLFGLGYISYMTFVIAFLRTQGVPSWQVALFWALLGACTFLSAFVWGRLISNARAGGALATLLFVVALGAALPLASTSLTGVLLSGLFFGGAFLSVVSAVTAIVRRGLPPHAWAGGIALFTVVFSLGQILGPLLSGVLADVVGGLAVGFLLSAGFLLAGAVIALFQADLGDAGS